MPETITPCPACGAAADFMVVEYSHTMPEHHDGWSEKRCLECDCRVGRWSGRVLGDGEAEMPPWRVRRENAKIL